MSYTFKLDSTDATKKMIAAVRDEIDDQTSVETPKEGTDYFLSDERIKRRLTDATRIGRTESNVIKLAAASALDTLATNQTYVLKVGSTLGETRDGAKVGDSIRKHAASLRAQVAEDETALPTSDTVTETNRLSSVSVPIVATL